MPNHRKYPSDVELRRLYLDEQRSAYDIATMYDADISSLYKLFRRAGISVRKGNVETCVMLGCGEPVQRIRHSNNGASYGRLCKEHRRKHRTKLSRDYQRQKKGIAPERYKPWQRHDNELTDYEMETLWIIQAKKQLRQTVAYLRNQNREA